MEKLDENNCHSLLVQVIWSTDASRYPSILKLFLIICTFYIFILINHPILVFRLYFLPSNLILPLFSIPLPWIQHALNAHPTNALKSNDNSRFSRQFIKLEIIREKRKMLPIRISFSHFQKSRLLHTVPCIPNIDPHSGRSIGLAVIL